MSLNEACSLSKSATVCTISGTLNMTFEINYDMLITKLIPVAALAKAWVCFCSLAGTGGFASRLGHGYLSLVSVVCCQVEICAQRSPNECGREASIMRVPSPLGAVAP
jgi:hypothetical protein